MCGIPGKCLYPTLFSSFVFCQWVHTIWGLYLLWRNNPVFTFCIEKCCCCTVGEAPEDISQDYNCWLLCVPGSLCTMLSLQWEPEIIAVAVMYLAGRLCKFDIQEWTAKQSSRRWWEQFVQDVPVELLEGADRGLLVESQRFAPPVFVYRKPLVLQISAIRSWICIPRGTSLSHSSYKRRSGCQLLQHLHLQPQWDSHQPPTLLPHHQRRPLLREAALHASSNAHMWVDVWICHLSRRGISFMFFIIFCNSFLFPFVQTSPKDEPKPPGKLCSVDQLKQDNNLLWDVFVLTLSLIYRTTRIKDSSTWEPDAPSAHISASPR